MSSYNPNIPQPNNVLSISQSQLLANFGQLNTQFSVDHSPFWTGSSNGTGHHNQVTFDQAASVPSPSGTQPVVYPAIPATYTTQELMFANATTTEQLTNSTLVAANGEGFVPGGLQIRSGSGSFTAGVASLPIAYSKRFPTASICVQATPIASQGILFLSASPSATGFTLNRPNGNGTESFTWIAIGY